MKKLLFYIILLVRTSAFAQVGVGTTTPESSAALDVTSTTKGFLPPRMTQVQMFAINGGEPANGLMVYCSDCAPAGFYGYVNGNWGTLGASASVTVNCSANGFSSGAIIKDVALSNASFSVTLTNNAFSSATISFAATDVALSGGSSGITVGSPTGAPALGGGGIITLAAGQSVIITYPLTGTPTASGTLTATWTKASLTCTKSKIILLGSATFTLPQDNRYVISTYDGSPLIDIQGVIDNSANKIIINIPYASGVGSYSGYSSDVITGAAGQNGDSNGFSISYPGGTFATAGNIPVTVTVNGDGIYNAKKLSFLAEEAIVSLPLLNNGNTVGNLSIVVAGAAYDRMYGIADASGNTESHKFVYLPVIAEDGRIWLNNNLGSNYSNKNSTIYNPLKQATAFDDFNAYGSFFQWGRKSDGHELINWTGSTQAAGTATTLTNSDTPLSTAFITEDASPYDWRVSQSDSLWLINGTNNPCPVGFRPPTQVELLNLKNNSTSYATNIAAASSILKIPSAGVRGSNGSLGGASADNIHLYTNSVIGTDTYIHRWVSTATDFTSIGRVVGASVRCIKD